MAILTALELRTNYINLDDDTQDDLLDVWISWASERIQTYCNTTFESRLYQDIIFSGDGKDRLTFTNQKVFSITSLYERADAFSSWWVISTEDYVLISENGVDYVLAKNGFTKGVGNYKITFTAGYDVIPSVVKRVCAEMVKELKGESEKLDGSGRLGQSSIQRNIGGVSETISFVNMWESKWKPMLKSYRFGGVIG